VRSFRVLLMRDDDARATRRPALREVELTVWDVLSLAFDGGPAGQFKEGQTFLVSISRSCAQWNVILTEGFFFLCHYPFLRRLRI
jgi:hypothetical protein